MREVEFRSLNADGEWCYGLPYYDCDGDLDMSLPSGYSDYGDIKDTLGQYTGMKDKNGVKIYEGDILKCGDGYLWEVKWSEVNCGFLAEGEDISTLKFDADVIGNIHQNPELLNG